MVRTEVNIYLPCAGATTPLQSSELSKLLSRKMIAYTAESSTSCKWHSKQTLDRNLHDDILNAANERLKAALFNRRSEAGCLESINAALNSIPDGTLISRKKKLWDPKKYIQNEWLATRRAWANYNRVHEYILMQ